MERRGVLRLATTARNTSKQVTFLLNGTLASIKSVVPMAHQVNQPGLTEDSVRVQYGVLIGTTGDIKGNLVLHGETTLFSLIGETMFGMPLDGQMLESFSGELGNMIAGGLATNIAKDQVNIDITHPTILQGNTRLSGFKKAINIPVLFHDVGKMDIYFLLD